MNEQFSLDLSGNPEKPTLKTEADPNADLLEITDPQELRVLIKSFEVQIIRDTVGDPDYVRELEVRVTAARRRLEQISPGT